MQHESVFSLAQQIKIKPLATSSIVVVAEGDKTGKNVFDLARQVEAEAVSLAEEICIHTKVAYEC